VRLLLVELNRFRSRRAVVLILVAGLLIVAWMALSTIRQTRTPSATELEGARQAAAQAQGDADQEYLNCQKDPTAYMGPGTTADQCQRWAPGYEDFLPHSQLSLAEERGDTGKGAIILLAGLAIIVGATYAGADWATGSMSNQLLFKPRRIPFWTAKAVAVTLGVTAVAAVILAGLWGSYLLTAEARGIGHSPGFVQSLSREVLRGLALIAGGALGGYSLTMLLRSTVGTLALLFAYSVGGEALIANLPITKVGRWSLGNNVFGWLDNGHEVFDDSIKCVPSLTGECNQSYVVSMMQGATYLGITLLVVVLVSLLLFRRRDVP
jgi:ABC-2 type transport system permease protein